MEKDNKESEQDFKEVVRLKIDGDAEMVALFGSLDGNLRVLERVFGVELVLRHDELVISGSEPRKAQAVIEDLLWILESGEIIDEQKLEYVISLQQNGQSYRESEVNRDIVAFTHRGKPIKAKTIGQGEYVKAIRNRDIVFGIGPAGTGKTYLAVAMAVNALKNKDVEKIVLARPAVEAGERLGFLPGDLQEKVDPYLRPLYDALYEIMGRDTALRLKEKETIEVVPLAYMRGRTLDNAFIILDEAQNTTREQMKMFLTRMGFGSRVVVTGDVTQIDLPDGKTSGLIHASRVLGKVDEISFCYLHEADVVRHSLVKRIIVAYEYHEKRVAEKRAERLASEESERVNRAAELERRTEKKPYARDDRPRRDDSEKKPYGRDDKGRGEGERKPYARNAKPYGQGDRPRNDGERKPYGRGGDSDKKPYVRREDRDERGRADSEEKPQYTQGEDGDRPARKPDHRTEGKVPRRVTKPAPGDETE